MAKNLVDSSPTNNSKDSIENVRERVVEALEGMEYTERKEKGKWKDRFKNLQDGQFIVEKSSPARPRQFASHVKYLKIAIKPSESTLAIELRLNMFCLTTVKNDVESLDEFKANSVGVWADRIYTCAQFVVVGSNGITIKGASKDGYDRQYLSGPIKDFGDFEREFRTFRDNQHKSFGRVKNEPLLSAEEWKSAKWENSNRALLYGLVEAKLLKKEEAKERYAEGAYFYIDSSTLNIHPPKEVIDATLALLARNASNQDVNLSPKAPQTPRCFSLD